MPDETPPHAKRATSHHGRPRASELLDIFVEGHPDDRIVLGDLITLLGDRAFGALLLIFALPNMIPVPLPGLSTVLGLPMVLFAAQLMLGHPAPWLPARLARLTVRRETFLTMVGATKRYLVWAERLLRPRWSILTDGPGERLLGAVCLLLSLILILPIPLGNLLPAFAVALMALGLLEKDGVCVTIGLCVAAGSVTVVVAVVVLIVEAALLLYRQLFP
ncbi:exopolysaccharide biosynthesis protein [Skermanella sp. TT6]|uniref:Exopolysaccharide biosynthesis protein n=1 Tax=Skermanella cutis TaxID=2775420 RepID=A0ABX7B7N1_9PROT|nr:exopolysaccharide biosynthesis protein [Skermanella sp. TT6]QQP89610.1 exopolysaccharide biosynthesis protein [Skermanella sp. TT6]